MEMDVSGCLRSLTLGGHEVTAVFDALVVQPERVGEAIEVLKKLLGHYPGIPVLTSLLLPSKSLLKMSSWLFHLK